jgi:hypothetical protein
VDQLALIVARVVEIYLALGLVFAVAFAARGVDAIDPAARGSTRGFRLMIVPGAIALWPLLLRRWLAGAPPPTERNAHRDAASGDEA